MAVPLIGLYGISIIVSWFITRSRERAQATAAKEEASSQVGDPPANP
jgi:Sec-independent protein secretion pathway component TatC